MHQFTPTSIRTSTQNLVFMSYPHTINRTSTTINQTNPHNLNLCTHTSFTTLKSKSGSNVLPRNYEPTSPHKLTYRHVQTSQPWSQNLVRISYPNTINRTTAHILNLSTHTSFTTINASFLIMKPKWVFVSGFFPLCSVQGPSPSSGCQTHRGTKSPVKVPFCCAFPIHMLLFLLCDKVSSIFR